MTLLVRMQLGWSKVCKNLTGCCAGLEAGLRLRYVAARTQHFHNLTEQMTEHLRGELPLFPGVCEHLGVSCASNKMQ